jgi:hypothetical protein
MGVLKEISDDVMADACWLRDPYQSCRIESYDQGRQLGSKIGSATHGDHDGFSYCLRLAEINVNSRSQDQNTWSWPTLVRRRLSVTLAHECNLS